MSMSIEQDGYTYTFELSDAAGHATVKGLLRHNPDLGWYLTVDGDDHPNKSVTIGRRAKRAKLVYDTLTILEAELADKVSAAKGELDRTAEAE
jgi:hypothetical protein